MIKNIASQISYSPPVIPEAPVKKPFEEMNLSPEQIDKKIEKLARKGYFTVKASETTKAFLQKLSNADNGWNKEYFWKSQNLVGSDYEKQTTALAGKVIDRIDGNKPSHLEPQEFQVRRLFGKVADRWHQDKEPKKIISIIALAGSGTEFVSPEVAKEKFPSGRGIAQEPTGGEQAIKADIHQAKKDRFYFFLGRSMKETDFPVLVHRSPQEGDRSIFMGRWREKTPRPE